MQFSSSFPSGTGFIASQISNFPRAKQSLKRGTGFTVLVYCIGSQISNFPRAKQSWKRGTGFIASQFINFKRAKQSQKRGTGYTVLRFQISRVPNKPRREEPVLLYWLADFKFPARQTILEERNRLYCIGSQISNFPRAKQSQKRGTNFIASQISNSCAPNNPRREEPFIASHISNFPCAKQSQKRGTGFTIASQISNMLNNPGRDELVYCLAEFKFPTRQTNKDYGTRF